MNTFTYETIMDAYTALDNSGVSEWIRGQPERVVLAERMFEEDESPEQAFASVFGVDEHEAKALGIK